ARDREQLATIQRELETARTIQHLLVPRTFPPFPDRTDFDLHAQMTSARDREQLATIQRELETARTIQHLLVPRTFPPFPDRTDFDLHAQMTSARAVGGDFFDFFLIDQDRLGVVIGDVSGKGIPAALYMAVT